MAVPPGGEFAAGRGHRSEAQGPNGSVGSPGYGESYKGNTSREAETTYGLYGRG